MDGNLVLTTISYTNVEKYVLKEKNITTTDLWLRL